MRSFLIVKTHKFLFDHLGSQVRKKYCRNMSTLKIGDETNFLGMAKQIVPVLTTSKHKGADGRICVIGGSLEYTGAPYFAAISALKLGADLVHVFCSKESSVVIKSYSPELIVHPLLDAEESISLIEPWLERFHVIIIGPGLGRASETMDVVSEIINKCRSLNKPLVIDADGLYLVSCRPEIIQDYPLAILTPNAVEFSRIFKTAIQPTESENETVKKLKAMGEHIVIVRKGEIDSIFDTNNVVMCTTAGSGRRCGGQGDLLSGTLGTFLAWSLMNKLVANEQDLNLKAMITAYAACNLTRKCNAKAFSKYGRSMTTSDMIEQIHTVFSEVYEKQ